jgi:hypothetical protein
VTNAPLPHRQRGAASLAVVMVLFFILAMVAAYTNRNLIFEQRTSANSYRSARSLAAADAGVDWTIAMLNGGAIGTACTSAGATDEFRTRYLTLQPDGSFKAVDWPTVFAADFPEGPKTIQAQPSCSGVEGGGWACSCPILSPPAQLDAANSEHPTFTVKFADSSPGVVVLKVRACNSSRAGTITSSNVNDFGSCHVVDVDPGVPGFQKYVQVDAMTVLRTSLGLVSALPIPPSAALTVAGSINQSGGMLTAINPDPMTGLALHAGGTIDGAPATVTLKGPAGSTAILEAPSDKDLSDIDADDFFRKALGLPADKYKEQPAAVTIECGAGCAANAAVLPVLAKGPTRVIFINGNLDLDDATIGSTATPAILVVTGNVTVSGLIDLKGVLFVGGNLNWTSASGKVNGAVIVGGDYTGTGNATIAYDRNIVQRIHKGYGSFVRIPGTWHMES